MHPLIARLGIVCCFALADSLAHLHASERPATTRLTIYNYVPKHSELGQDAAKAVYSRKFRIVDFHDDSRYERSKCTFKVIPQPQRTPAGRLITGYVRVVLIVTTEGRVLEPFVLRSTEARLNGSALEAVKKWRGTPARLNGSPIPIILHQDFRFR